jgi:hypothetical protein
MSYFNRPIDLLLFLLRLISIFFSLVLEGRLGVSLIFQQELRPRWLLSLLLMLVFVFVPAARFLEREIGSLARDHRKHER